MIEKALTFLKDEANKFMRLKTGSTSMEERVVLSNIVDIDQNDSIGLPENKIVLSLICIEEERHLKSQDHYARMNDGTLHAVNPELRFNLYVMFAAHFNNLNYAEALKFLSLTIRCFQARNVFDAKEFPSLQQEVDRLVVDLWTQPMDQQSQLWQAMGGKFLPSVMYKVRLLTIQEGLAQRESTRVSEVIR